jgi:hypothetical protein
MSSIGLSSASCVFGVRGASPSMSGGWLRYVLRAVGARPASDGLPRISWSRVAGV